MNWSESTFLQLRQQQTVQLFIRRQWRIYTNSSRFNPNSLAQVAQCSDCKLRLVVDSWLGCVLQPSFSIPNWTVLYRQRKIVHDQDHRYRTCNYTTRTMTRGPGTSASNDFLPFKNYTDLKDTLKTFKRYRNEVSHTINIENVWYINSCSTNR